MNSDQFGGGEPNSRETSVHEVEFMLNTIREYTAEMKKNHESAEKHKQTAIMLMMFIVFIFVIFSYFIAPLDSQSPQGIQIQSLALIHDEWTRTLLGIFSGGGFLIIGLALILTIRRLFTVRDEIERISRILKVLVRRASQLGDRGRQTFAQNIMLDVIVTDAQSFIIKYEKSKTGFIEAIIRILSRFTT